ncbi:VOC family protein [Devosia sp.]|uniref:VOC family protein n=1 Tax=Devosia sp. TaxID=1871048 RepID=UPI00326716DB
MLLGFEHIGMTSRNLDRTIGFYCDLLGLKLVLRKQGDVGDTAFLDSGSGMLEIFGRTERTGISRDVPHYEAGVRHITFAFDDIDVLFEKLVAAGIEPVEKPRPARYTEMFRRVAFVRDPDGILVELVERTVSR